MAERSILWPTNGVGDGVNSGYTQADVTEWQRMLFAGLTGSDLSGVAPDYLNELAVTGTSSPVAVNTGGAIVYGFPYFNTASVNVAVPTPSTLTRIDRVVLEVNWTAQTVRITRVAGSEGGIAPTLTQSAGVTWQMSLARVSITTAGVITVTDEREWLSMVGDGAISTQKLADSAVTTAKLGSESVTTAKLGDNSVTSAKLVNTAVTTDKIADDSITQAKMTNNSIGTAELIDAAVTAAKLAPDAVTPDPSFIVASGSHNSYTGSTHLNLSGATEVDPGGIFSLSGNIITVAQQGYYRITALARAANPASTWSATLSVTNTTSGGSGVYGGITAAMQGSSDISFASSCTLSVIALITAGSGVRMWLSTTDTINVTEMLMLELVKET